MAKGESVKREPIAIVGIGCRFPGGIHSPRDFWNFIRAGKDGITEAPPDRWDLRKYYHPDRTKPGKIYTRKGGFLEGIEKFDPQVFGISPREAAYMDPQQRLLLEVTWEALEDGGFAPESVAGRQVGVFVGLFVHDFENLHAAVTEHSILGPHSATGMSTTIAANRISYIFDFKGPSMVLDTACSSSLVGVHLACQSLLSGESELAVAGGVNVIFKPEMSMVLSKASMLSPDGYCKSFDARANGYTRSEGAAVVVLKRLSRALADGDPVYALIRGSAVNQDGRTAGITVPSGAAQERMIRDALHVAGVNPEDVQYVEAHGTGTPTGDPIEARALGAVFSQNRPQSEACVIGSVKSNIGHTESTAGVAGLIKAALMLQHGQIPPNLHFETPNPDIPFEELKLRVPTALEPWPGDGSKPRMAGVNSFGFGGTNAHVIVEEFCADPDETSRTSQALDRPAGQAVLVPLSAHTPEALNAAAGSYAGFLRQEAAAQGIATVDVARTAALHRGHHPQRLAVVAGSMAELLDRLEAYRAGEQRSGTSAGRALPDAHSGPVFVFSGMGQQALGMGQVLLEREPVFRQAVEACNALFARHTRDWSLLGELTAPAEASRINETQIAQPCIFALQVGLAALWRSWGIAARAVVGHSLGEVAAAHVAGILSLEDAVRVCFHRSRLQQRTAGQGTMLAAGLTQQEAERMTAAYAGKVTLAAANSAASVTLAGEAEALREIAAVLEEEGRFARFLNVEVPYHSPFMDPILPEYTASLRGIAPGPGRVPMISTVTGSFVDGSQLDETYWARNLRDPVWFAKAMATLTGAGYDTFVEVSAHPVLAASMRECLTAAGKTATIVPSLRRGEPEDAAMLAGVGKLYTAGFPVDWKALYGEAGQFVRLPAYPWQREPYWSESEESQQVRKGLRTHSGQALVGEQVHPLLGGRLEAAMPTWSAEIDTSQLEYLSDHVVQGSVVYPGAAYIEMGLAAGREVSDGEALVLEDVEIAAPLLLPAGAPVTLQLRVEGGDSFAIHGKQPGAQQGWVLHAAGKLGRMERGSVRRAVSVEAVRARLAESGPGDACYRSFQDRGLEYGPSFQGLQQVWYSKSEVLGRIRVPADVAGRLQEYVLHPAVLDACFQVLGAIPAGGTFLPVKAERIFVYGRSTAEAWGYAQLVEQGSRRIKGNIQLLDDAGNLIAEVEGLHCLNAGGAQRAGTETVDRLLYEYEWRLQRRPDDPTETRDAGYLPAPGELCRLLAPEGAKLAQRYGAALRDALTPELDALAAAYTSHCLEQLGWSFDADASFTAAELAAQLNVAAEQRLLFHHLLELLAREGRLKKSGERWEVVGRAERPDPRAKFADLLRRFPAALAELTLLERCGTSLGAVLRGEVVAPQVIAPGDAVLEHLHRDSPTFRMYNWLVRRTVSAILAQLPEGRTLRVLETGARAGGFTPFVLPLLPENRVEYVWAGPSEAAAAQAGQEFPDRKGAQFTVLDLAQDPAGQGFVPHSFDLVLGTDVTHVDGEHETALLHLQTLLASEGLLVLLEPVQPPAWLQLVLGMTQGWQPSRAVGRWVDLLESLGFTDTHPAAEREEPEPLQSLILARGPRVSHPQEQPATSPQSPPGEGGRPYVLLADELGVAQRLAEVLQQGGADTWIVSRGSSCGQPAARRFLIRDAEAGDLQQMLDCVTAGTPGSPVLIDLMSMGRFSADTTPAELERLVNGDCIRTMQLIQALVKRDWQAVPQLWLVTNGAQTVGGTGEIALAQAPLWGVGRVAINEYGGLRTSLIDVSPAPSPQEVESLGTEILMAGAEDEIALRGPDRYVRRLVRRQEQPGDEAPTAAFEVIKERARPQAEFVFRELQRRAPGPGEVEVEVRAVGLNFKDLAKSSGLLDGSAVDEGDLVSRFGLECSGVVSAVGSGVDGVQVGDEVMVLAFNCLVSHVITRAELVVPKPKDLTFEAAATIPLGFVTACYALRRLARVQPGERVLIHTASGGMGLAAVQVAQLAGAEVLATAGSPEKRAFLRSLGVTYAGDSRSLTFAQEIMDLTRGEGVDVVINTLPEKGLVKSLSLLKPITGRCVDLTNMHAKASLGLQAFNKGIAFFAFDLELMVRQSPPFVGTLLKEMVQEFDCQQLHPLPYRTFPVADIAGAIRHMRKARHIGKLVAAFGDPGVVPVPALDRLQVRPDATYLITGGLGGFGLATARWLAECGARHLVLVGRSGAATPRAREQVEALQRAGVQIAVRAVDVTREEQVREMLQALRSDMPPLRGVIHAAMVLADGQLSEMTPDQMRTVLGPKVLGAWNLHRLTLDTPLDFFVSFSSFATLVGNPSQGNYVAGNLFLDTLAHYRRAMGLPGLTICWGAIADVGVVAQDDRVREILNRQGIGELRPEQAWQVIRYGIERGLIQVGAMQVDWGTMAEYSVAIARSPRFAAVRSSAAAGGARDEAGEDRERLRARLRSPRERRQYLLETLAGEVARVLGVSPSSLKPEQAIDTLGMDSLIAVELNARIEKATGVFLPKMALLQKGINVLNLVELVEKEMLKQDPTLAQEDPDVEPAAEPVNVDGLSDGEVERLLQLMLKEER